jgi:hypothetical protein
MYPDNGMSDSSSTVVHYFLGPLKVCILLTKCPNATT